jgi:hypothetical protein
MIIARNTLAAILAGAFLSPAMADEKEDLLKIKKRMDSEREELLELKNTAVNLVELFVEQGLLDKQKAERLINKAKAKAQTEAKQQLAREQEEEQLAGNASAAAAGPGAGAGNGKPVFVGYVPEFVKEEIRNQVRADLKNEVVEEVKADAKAEQWGIPAALPEWIGNTKLSFDMRVRGAEDFFQEDNEAFLDYLTINQEGGHLAARNKGMEYLNTTKDRFRFSERFRLSLDAKITDHLKAGIRLATSNIRNPVSNDQALGNTGQSFEFAIDRGFIQYDFVDKKGNDWFSVYAGRFANPWVSTDVVYDPDLSFQGLAGTFRYRFNQGSDKVKAYKAALTNDLGGRAGINFGPQTPDSVFATLGVFPIQEINLSTADKWLFGGQLGADWLVQSDSRLKVAAAYYGYKNIRARPNARGSFENDWTAPEFIQKGNSLVPINLNDGFNPRCTSAQSAIGQGCLYGLASDFRIFNLTAIYDIDFAGTHVVLTGDYAKNFGYDAARIEREFPGLLADNTDRTSAFQVRLDIGDPDVRRFMAWNVFLAYRYVERDAVLDAFTESLFHAGGTNAKGWWLGGSYGLARNTWVNLRWSSTDSIHGPRLSIDTAAVDLNVRF